MNRFHLSKKTVAVVLTLLTLFGTGFGLMAQQPNIWGEMPVRGRHEIEKWFVGRVLIFLSEKRRELQRQNLVDLYEKDHFKNGDTCPESAKIYRTADGTCNNLEEPLMGSAGVRFGRNTPESDLKKGIGEGETGLRLITPNPREVSEKLLARNGAFKPVGGLNLLAATWIQFMNHDWFNHIESPQPATIVLEGTKDDPEPMLIKSSHPDTSGSPSPVVPYVNENTHWWDGSQIYGSDAATVRSLRVTLNGSKAESDRILAEGKGGFMRVEGTPDQPRIPVNRGTGYEETGFRRNWWLGLSLMHQLFVLNHNKIAYKLYHAKDCKPEHLTPGLFNSFRKTFNDCSLEEQAYKSKWTDESLFQTARLINAAIMAKIHTIEWTPAILNHPGLYAGMHVNWTGHTGFTDNVGLRLNFFGLVGKERKLHGVPYSLTEEFVSVYRLHSFLPEDLQMRRMTEPNRVYETLKIEDTRDEKSHVYTNSPAKLSDMFFSFSKMNPGALTLKNFPDFLRNLNIPGVGRVDMGAVDIFRDRERGVPRYNQFRRSIHLPEIRNFTDLTSEDEAGRSLAREISDVYRGKIEDIDLLVGTLAEDQSKRPQGFAFGETQFRIFLLMASRRLESDRFFTKVGYTKEIYTELGMKMIDEASMSSVICANMPELGSQLIDVKNAFVPWNQEHQTKLSGEAFKLSECR